MCDFHAENLALVCALLLRTRGSHPEAIYSCAGPYHLQVSSLLTPLLPAHLFFVVVFSCLCFLHFHEHIFSRRAFVLVTTVKMRAQCCFHFKSVRKSIALEQQNVPAGK